MLLLPLLLPLAAARILNSPEDPFAFPKYRVDFLNHLPLANETAQHWLAHGLAGGEREFLEQPWDDFWHPPALGNGDDQLTFVVADQDVSLQSPDAADDYALEYLKMGPDEYLCLVPKPLEAPPPEEEPEEDITAAHSWSLLLPLAGTCLYHRQAWFTYSYCHNEEIRQFRELIQARPLPTGAHPPEEDPDWESYTLGRAPATAEPGADLTVAQQDAIAADLELARSAGSRYLVQRWGDGTICDKTGKPREVEVQFHCSMATTDTIAFIKESKTCAYVLVVHTPRLCGEPGFMSSRDAGEQASIACREVVAGEPSDQSDAAFLPDADHPLKLAHQRPKLPPPPPPKVKDATTGSNGKYSEALRKALDTLKEINWQGGEVELFEDGEAIVFEIPLEDDDNFLEDGEYDADRIAHVLREAGFDIKMDALPEKTNNKKKKTGEEKQDESDAAADRRRKIDELL
ncbi:hypothetical protein FB45DRAFT_912705 [Roridomyces roridus]|uniref:Protein OS-9 homolog n=1 Tax=Roridomyces roridus TaxID=1738132 RepID=A0AAD7BWQ3_9AGAR|nr:hypothetical protein FB45DRAFT_912705 [Roridomyces roridus]